MTRDETVEAIRQALSRDRTISWLSSLLRKWNSLQGFKCGWDNVAEKLMLVVTELAEAMEAYREKNPTGETIIHFEEELADVAIRLFDLCGGLGIDLRKAIASKMVKNFQRPYLHGKTL